MLNNAKVLDSTSEVFSTSSRVEKDSQKTRSSFSQARRLAHRAVDAARTDSKAVKKLVIKMVADAVEAIRNMSPLWPIEYEWLFNDDYPGGLKELAGSEAVFFRRIARKLLVSS